MGGLVCETVVSVFQRLSGLPVYYVLDKIGEGLSRINL